MPVYFFIDSHQQETLNKVFIILLYNNNYGSALLQINT